ncbi:N-acetylneuraminate synthase [Pontibacter sp. E15-1]|uniref:N-acetylneuraminate synthase n=1 Tax=Pontibacter sp. E15-1 TaxID=2919918 RepID=UPI001F4FD195|nr:N-acetylneuraminate synthase [Pontibacter sp. E15-1]MCJ8166415.1 N-acetylneuraminate synthase [Pontibacter sp. E15-1]
MKRSIIIAEAGVNHNGDINLAKQLINVAAQAGADYVKFQTFRAEKLVSKEAQKADYQNRNFQEEDNSQYGMLKKLELSEEDHHILLAHAVNKGIKFLSTGFDEDSIDFLEKLGVDIFKIPSGEITNYPYLQHIAQKGKPVILSTGMSTMDEIGEAIEVLISSGVSRANLTVLHCTTEYPAPLAEVNLRAMTQIGEVFGVKIGYSDHTPGIEVPIAAAALGAAVIEKHFTLDRELPGPDHKASLEPMELSAMIKSIRNVELALGSPEKVVTPSEEKNRAVARKSIFVAHDLHSGHILKQEDLVMKRPGNGISPMRLNQVLGKELVKEVRADAMLQYDFLK